MDNLILSNPFKSIMMMTITVIGSGKIVEEVLQMFIDEQLPMSISSIYAHSNIHRTQSLADRFGIPKVFTDYAELLATDKSDIVYIANVNSAHYEYARKALLAGRHVIVEKPMCLSAGEVSDLISLAVDKNLMFAEAVSLLYMPNLEGIRSALKNIGNVKMVRCDYSQYSSRYDAYMKGEILPAFDTKLGGGALRDLNVYNLNFILALFGMPAKVGYHYNRGFNGVDTSGILMAEYPDFQCVCSAAKDSDGHSHAHIQGELGSIYIEGPVSILGNYTITLRSSDKNCNFTKEHFQLNTYRHRLAHEFAELSKIFHSGDLSVLQPYHKISLAVAEIIDRAMEI